MIAIKSPAANGTPIPAPVAASLPFILVEANVWIFVALAVDVEQTCAFVGVAFEEADPPVAECIGVEVPEAVADVANT